MIGILADSMNIVPLLQTWTAKHWLPLLMIVVIAWVALRFGTMVIDKIVRRTIHRSPFTQEYLTPEDVKKRQDTLVSMLSAIWRASVWIVATLTVISEIALFNTAPLFASAGIVGIALGFGAQSIIRDLLTGIFIIIENQYRVGDVVDLQNNAIGTVERITIRSTILRDTDGNVHFVPNGTVAHVVNKTMGFSRINISLAVDPAINVDHLAEIINMAGEKMAKDPAWSEKLIDPPHFLSIGSFTDSALEVKITGKTQPSAQWSVTGELRKRLLNTFKRHKIELAKL